MNGLTELVLVALIVFIAIPAPLFIVLHFITKWKQSRELSGGDENMLEDLWQLSIRLEDRMEALETIIDNELPGWRKNR
ncbi:MAG: envelope stress response membrane protein PspB [Woeseia sp.]|nr:envelope stress response membrane protein PspB [Woeseia sp.]MBT8095825.1 envelope stress response membrane protein PspB [Woeseia sp.]NNE61725.1 envelope stress response membrane protein PspB [Woeseia sp.]NNL55079.1 envelope stress response membrane protein PspB [Woeseia sp.]